MFYLRLLPVLFLLCSGIPAVAQQNKPLAALWQQVVSLESRGLTRSAWQTVWQIYREAKSIQQPAEELKSCIYLLHYRSRLEEESDEKNIYWLDTLIRQARNPVKQVFLSMQAEMYWQYLLRNRWKLQQQTPLAGEYTTDISSWDIRRLYQVIADRYRASLDSAASSELRRTRLERYEPVIEKGVNTRHLRPTLYDLLAYRALDYISGVYAEGSQAGELFQLRDTAAFAPADAFIRHRFTDVPGGSVQLESLQILQQLLSFHQADQDPAALLDADLYRLETAYRFSVLPDKQTRYETALKQLEDKWPSHPVNARCRYLRAKMLVDSDQPVPGVVHRTGKSLLPAARALCDTAMSRFPGTEGAYDAGLLRHQILQPYLSSTAEKVNLPGDPFRVLIKYKNLSRIHARVVGLRPGELDTLDRLPYEARWQACLQLPVLRTWIQPLPDPGDHREHKTEIPVDPLPRGLYLILLSADEHFSMGNNILVRQQVWISDISYVSEGNKYYVLHRRTGQPLGNATLQLWENRYDYTQNRYQLSKAESYQTDEKGFCQLPPDRSFRNLVLQALWNGDELFTRDGVYSQVYDSYRTDQPVTSCHLFTDRSVYRPGQLVYFKGVVIRRFPDRYRNTEAATAFSSVLQVRDVNGQLLHRIPVITNEFGSYNGSFRLPAGLLNGQFSLYDSSGNGQLSILVEEYKRPKFQVELHKPDQGYRVHDTILIRGDAVAYAGNPLNGAQVRYKVTRKTRFQPWWDAGMPYRYRSIIPPGRSTETLVAAGHTTTNQHGGFQIGFPALPDPALSGYDETVFLYEVNADVTDLNGETRSQQLTVGAGYRSLQLSVETAQQASADSALQFTAHCTNFNDQPADIPLRIRITELVSPGRPLRERYWDQPDQYTMDKEAFKNLFPDDPYGGEHLVQNYPEGKTLTVTTGTSNQLIRLEQAPWKTGWYRLQVSGAGHRGDSVHAEHYFYLHREGESNPAQPVQWTLSHTSAAPGDTIHSLFRPAFPVSQLVQLVFAADSLVPDQILRVAAGSELKQSWRIGEKDRGGRGTAWLFIYNNRVYQQSRVIAVPWSNKALSVRYRHFRNKAEPGQEETWTVSVRGEQDMPVMAEVLASMYDASLDQFTPHQWMMPDIWPRLPYIQPWTVFHFNAAESESRVTTPEFTQKAYEKRYDRLLSLQPSDREAYWMKTNRQTMEDDGVKIAAAPPDKGEKTMSAVADSSRISVPPVSEAPVPGSRIRSRFNETAFFYPALYTDSTGSLVFSARLPDALTRWKLMTFAHSAALATGYAEQILTTQKKLMVQPNLPRLLREGDRMELPVKVVNADSVEITGTVTLQLMDAASGQLVDGWFKNVFPHQFFTLGPGESSLISFPIEIPYRFGSALQCRIMAAGSRYEDGEENILPVGTNRILLTASLPLSVQGSGTRSFRFPALLASAASSTLSHFALTAEYSSQPAWYVVQALPYLDRQPHEHAEQLFNRLFTNLLASHISREFPHIRKTYIQGPSADSNILLSNLQRNTELQQVLLDETPWVQEAAEEHTQRTNLFKLFNDTLIRTQTMEAIQKLVALQLPNGAFSWMKDGPGDRYMTQHILIGFGQLQRSGALLFSDPASREAVRNLVKQALVYLDRAMQEDHALGMKRAGTTGKNNLTPLIIQYLLLRSYFPDIPLNGGSQKAYRYYLKQAGTYWLSQGRYRQAMIALTLFRNGDKKTAGSILRSLRENAIRDPEMGMYWKEWNQPAWYWYQAPVESQALMIEAFSETGSGLSDIAQLKQWLLRQKQTTHWRSSRATASACYALLLEAAPMDLLPETVASINIRLQDTLLSNRMEGLPAAGYFKKRIDGKQVSAGMGNITVDIAAAAKPASSQSLSWGAVYWQYFEDMDRVQPSSTPLRLEREWYVERNSPAGVALEKAGAGKPVQTGDRLIVRIRLKVDRELEYVHMKDTRAAGLEPLSALSGYQYRNGTGYYQTNRDAATHFYFNRLYRGTYIFEYPLVAAHAGDFSAGVTRIQCLYAPEFSSNSEGGRLIIEPAAPAAP